MLTLGNLKPRELKQFAQGRTAVGSHTQAVRSDSLHFTVSKLTGSLSLNILRVVVSL